MKNVFGLNVIFSALTGASPTRASLEAESDFNPSPTAVSRARMLNRRAKRVESLEGNVRNAS